MHRGKFTIYQSQKFLSKLLDKISYNEYIINEYSEKQKVFDELNRALSLIDAPTRMIIHQAFWEENNNLPEYKITQALDKLRKVILCQ